MTGAVGSRSSPFLDQSRWVAENEFAVALRDVYPVSPHHTLVAPKRVVASLFELTDDEILGCWKLLRAEQEKIQREFAPNGFNIGVNVGAAAGQTIPHAHIHLIPRFVGDHPQPRGGVRAVIPGKSNY